MLASHRIETGLAVVLLWAGCSGEPVANTHPTADAGPTAAAGTDTVAGVEADADAVLDTGVTTDTPGPEDVHLDVAEATSDAPQPDAAWCESPLTAQGSTLCVSGTCIADACPTTVPGLEACATSLGCVLGSCAEAEVCVYVETGDFALITLPDATVPTGCIALDVCEPEVLTGGAPCERDWECESGECFGVDCAMLPTGFAFGTLRVCASAVCDGPNGTLLPCPDGDVQLVSSDSHCFCVPEDTCEQAADGG